MPMNLAEYGVRLCVVELRPLDFGKKTMAMWANRSVNDAVGRRSGMGREPGPSGAASSACGDDGASGPAREGWRRLLVLAIVLAAVLGLTFFLASRLRKVLSTAVERERERVLQDPAFRPPEAVEMVDGAPGTASVCRVVVLCPVARFEDVGGGVAVRMKGQAGPLPSGSPDLPVFTRGLQGHSDWKLKARVIRADYAWVTQGVDVAAVEVRETSAIDPVRSETHRVRRRSNIIYGADRFWPNGPVEIVDGMMGTSKLSRVAVCPVQYNPEQQLLRVSREVEFELYYQP